jgi:hypothetical protein
VPSSSALDPDWGVPAWFSEVAGQTTSTCAKGIQSLLILVSWSLWRERNARVFYDREKHPSRLVVEIRMKHGYGLGQVPSA